MTLKGKCALITGSTGGIGFSTAARLAAEGCDIILNGLAGAEEVAPRRDEIETGFGVRAMYHGADLRDPGQIADLMNAAAAFGGVDILVNNAVVRHFAPIEDFPVERWNEALAVNLSAVFHTVRLALPGMRVRNFGRIINMSSVYGSFATANRIDYVTTKTALIGLTRAVAIETVGHDITCNAICPGLVQTPAIDARIGAEAERDGISRAEATLRFLADRQPTGRFVAGDGVAALIAFLCGPGGRDITGAALPVDGGWLAS
ncbi:MAG: SDR family oxidoreductase [Xanthobacteraceae bacterium]|jgi:3-hydroxybutyrate dehydrogenase